MCNIECTTANAVTDSVVGQSLELMYAHRDAQLRSTQRRQWGVKQPRLDISLRERGQVSPRPVNRKALPHRPLSDT